MSKIFVQELHLGCGGGEQGRNPHSLLTYLHLHPMSEWLSQKPSPMGCHTHLAKGPLGS